MRYHALACDYDGTIASYGTVDAKTIAALRTVRDSGRKLLLVTGRRLDDLLEILPDMELFDRVVAENGALLYCPATREERLLGEKPPQQFLDRLVRGGAKDIAVGKVIVATWEPYETVALAAIRDLGLELQVTFNKGAVMILPSGVNKATGMAAALAELELSPHNVVGVGDAENDHAFLAACECSVAVANALDTLKQRVDWVTQKEHGEGVCELICELIASDLSRLEDRLDHRIRFGVQPDGREVMVKPYGVNILVAGTSGGGKSTLAAAFIERLAELQYQFLIVDPEGDFETSENGVVLGNKHQAPSVDEVLNLVRKPERNGIADLIGLEFSERPKFYEALMPRIHELRAKTGRPHWIMVDETHHVLPSSWQPAETTMTQHMYGMIFITLEPHLVGPAILSVIDVVIAIGDNADDTLRDFAEVAGIEPPQPSGRELKKGEALAWFRRTDSIPVWFVSSKPRTERHRHVRKYTEGELSLDLSFFFRGPKGKLNLRAQNLNIFVQMADGVDDETWTFHLRQGDLSHWFRDVIKDPDLAAKTEQVEIDLALTAAESRRRIKEIIQQRYTIAA